MHFHVHTRETLLEALPPQQLNAEPALPRFE
jgi:hypothetical protein